MPGDPQPYTGYRDDLRRNFSDSTPHTEARTVSQEFPPSHEWCLQTGT
jgi:hypothetical protein